jgi:acyl carrier protein
METTDIEQQVRTFLVDNFLFGRNEALRDDASLLGDVIDSTGVIELVVFVQEHFSITVEDDEVTAENLGSVNQVATFVAKKLGRKS